MDDRSLEAEKWREVERGYHPVCWPEVDLKSLIHDVNLNMSFKRPKEKKNKKYPENYVKNIKGMKSLQEK